MLVHVIYATFYKKKTVNLCRYMPLKENKMISFSFIDNPTSASFPVRAGLK